MSDINIQVRNKVAARLGKESIVCGNSDYVIVVDFDDEWAEHNEKVMRLVYEDGSYSEVEFAGNEALLPVISKHTSVTIGFIAGALKTTTGAYIPLIPSISDAGDVEEKTIQALEADANGRYEATGSVLGFNPVIVDVPQPQGEISITTNGEHDVTDYEVANVEVPADVEPLTVTENGTYTSEKDGYNPVTVEVPLPSGTKQITENGTHNVYDYAEANVDVQPTLQDKTITENGTYTADAGYDGFREVTVEVPKPVKGSTGIVDLRGVEFEGLGAAYLFYYNSDITEVKVNITDKVTSLVYMFGSCSKLETLDLSNWDTSNVTNMYGIFNGCIALTSLDISNWDTSNVTNMSGTFGGCIALTSLDISNWDTSNVAGMGEMFRSVRFTKLDLSNWDTSNVTNMGGMFTGSGNIKNFKLGAKALLNVMTNSNLLNNERTYYVPDDMVDTFKSATNWSAYASRIKGWSEIPEGLFD